MAWFPFGIYYPRKAVGLRGPPGIGFKLTDDGNYDMENKVLKNCHNPVDDQDVSTKHFVQTELEKNYFGLRQIIEDSKNNFNDSFLNFVRETAERIKNLDSALRGEIADSVSKLDDRFLSYGERRSIDVKGTRIGNVGDPIESKNAVNKRYLEKYVDNKVCYATTASGYITIRPSTNANAVIFTKFSGDALNSECKFSRNGFFRLGLYLDPQKIIDELIVVKLNINNKQYVHKMKVATEFVLILGEVKQDDQLKIFLRCDAEFTVQPFLKIEEIKWTLQMP